MVQKTAEKIVEVDTHIGCTTSGLTADSRTLIERARVECQNHWFLYNEPITVESCALAVSTLAIQFGDSEETGSAMSRPFGVAMLFAGINENEPELWHMDPSGTYTQYDAKAIGAGSEGAQQNLQEYYTDALTLKDAVELALTTLKQIMEQNLDSTNVEVMTMTAKDKFKMMPKEEMDEYIVKLPKN